METRIGVSSGGITGTNVESVRCIATPSPIHQPQSIVIQSSTITPQTTTAAALAINSLAATSTIITTTTPTAIITTTAATATTSSSSSNAMGSISGIAAAVAAAAISSGSMSQSPAVGLSGATPLPSTSGPRILSRNVNGTLVQTSVPQNEAELQLYRVMQRASLLGYYDTLLEMGGDDVQQLCDAGEEEFLEIMALVGMASKPLHVRRLQKALQEWITNPSLFQSPVVPQNQKSSTPSVTNYLSTNSRNQNSSGFISTSPTIAFDKIPTNNVPLIPLPSRSLSPVTSISAAITPAIVPPPPPPSATASNFRQSPSPNTPIAYTGGHSPGVIQVGTCESSCGSGATMSPSGLNAPPSPTQTTPTLLPSQVQRLAEAAERLAGNLRPLDPKPHNVKKKICKNLEQMVMAMPDTDPRRMDEIRKYAAIYGRFDCKRKPEKPLTLHEVSVNEAAAQICRFVPALLTRRDELFPLARRVVRDSGYHYSKSQFLSMTRPRDNGDDSDMDRVKRRHLEDPEGEDTSQIELDLRCTGGDINNSILRRHGSSSPVWRKKNNNGVFGTSIEEVSDTDSQFSFSNDESSPLHDPNDFEVDNTDKESDFNLKIIASRGDNIIAVANPALMDCSHPIKKESNDEKSTL